MASVSQIHKCEESELRKLAELHRFGLYYISDEDDILKRVQSVAFEHVIEKTGGNPSETRENFMSAVGGVEQAAKNAYSNGSPEDANLEGGEFRRLMVRQGIFFLLNTLAILGADAEQLKYSADNFILGNRNDLERRQSLFFKSIFFPGNQIPLVVLHKLLEQPFFKDVLEAKAKWEKPDQSSLPYVLYNYILAPALRKRDTQHTGWMNWLPFAQLFSCSYISTTPTSWPTETPVDILHGLYLHVVGPAEGGVVDTVKPVWEEFADREYTTIDIGEEDQETQRIPNATNLHQLGIWFKSTKGLGIRQIHLRRHLGFATVCLPTIDDNTISMLTFLLGYENSQGLIKRDVSAYLRLLSEIISTGNDATLLHTKGVIQIEQQKLDKLQCLLKLLARRTVSNGNFRPASSTNFQLLGVHITQYSQRPKYTKYIGAIGILTLIAAIFTALQYFKKDGH